MVGQFVKPQKYLVFLAQPCTTGSVDELNLVPEVHGPSRYLNDGEEKELVRFLLGCAKIGFARTWKQVLGLVRQWWLRSREKKPR